MYILFKKKCEIIKSNVEEKIVAIDVIADIKKAAEEAQTMTGFIYEPTSGLYYDKLTGYYYNAVRTNIV